MTAEERESELVQWTSRERRKLHSLLDTGRGSTWWAPGAIGWWVGVLFAIGASLFALSAAPGYAHAVGGEADALTFFIGSIFFTTASLMQYLQTVNVPRAGQDGRASRRLHILTWEPRRVDWWSCVVQFVGTVFFNVSTFNAMRANMSVPQIDHLVWRPDAYGSICFLVASELAWMEFSRGAWSWEPGSISWWIAGLNLLGSIGFGVSAVAAYVAPTTGNAVNVALVNLGTFVGALCFLAGGMLLLPERTLRGN